MPLAIESSLLIWIYGYIPARFDLLGRGRVRRNVRPALACLSSVGPNRNKCRRESEQSGLRWQVIPSFATGFSLSNPYSIAVRVVQSKFRQTVERSVEIGYDQTRIADLPVVCANVRGIKIQN
jgi:hypothetical protein